MEHPELTLFSISKAAEIMHVGKEAIHQLIKKGKLGFIEVGERKRIPYLEIERYIKENIMYCTTISKTIDWNDQNDNSNSTKEFNSTDLFNKMIGDL